MTLLRETSYSNPDDKKHVFFISSLYFHAALVHVVNANKKNPAEKIRAIIYDPLKFYTSQMALELLSKAMKIEDDNQIEIIFGKAPKQVDVTCVVSALMNFFLVSRRITDDIIPMEINYSIGGVKLYDLFYKIQHQIRRSNLFHEIADVFRENRCQMPTCSRNMFQLNSSKSKVIERIVKQIEGALKLK